MVDAQPCGVDCVLLRVTNFTYSGQEIFCTCVIFIPVK